MTTAQTVPTAQVLSNEKQEQKRLANRRYARAYRQRNRAKCAAYMRSYYKRKPETVNAPKEAWRARNLDKCSAKAKRWQAKNPEKTKAQRLLNNAIRSGQVQREPCFVCGKLKGHGHHVDYSKPLDVTWLCAKHHKEAHRVGGQS